MNIIYIGGTYQDGRIIDYDLSLVDDDIKDIEVVSGISLISEELSIDELRFSVTYIPYNIILLGTEDYDVIMSNDEEPQVLATSDAVSVEDFSKIPYGTTVWCFSDKRLIGKYYISQIIRNNINEYGVTCVSAVGLLDNMSFNGGVYNGNITAGALIDEILYDANISYTVDDALYDAVISGYLPIDTKRNSLHQIMFAQAINIVKNSDGSLRFTFLDNKDFSIIPDTNIYLDSKVDDGGKVTTIELTQHTYSMSDNDEEVTLFDNTAAEKAQAMHSIVKFTDPCHDIQALDDLIIDDGEFNENYAIVSGRGRLVGKKYNHQTTAIIRSSGDEQTTTGTKVISDRTLVNLLNGQNVMNRLYAYYTSSGSVEVDIKNNNELCGDTVALTTSYGKQVSGYITSLNSDLSSFIKSKTKIITGYVTQGFGNYYSKQLTFTENGTFTILPEMDGKEIILTLIGGGSGGDGGFDGKSGTTIKTRDKESTRTIIRYITDIGHGGDGGKAGKAGQGGKIYSFIIKVDGVSYSVGDTFSVEIGTGGIGGDVNGGLGTSGTVTLLKSGSDVIASSDFGYHSSKGIPNLFTGVICGEDGKDGLDGGNGGNGGVYNNYNETGIYPTDPNSDYVAGTNGQDVLPYIGGKAGGAHGSYNTDIYNSEAGGGGAAFGANGKDAAYVWYSSSYRTVAGDGANAVQPNNSEYGNGGHGGHGGGGGGGASDRYEFERSGATTYHQHYSNPSGSGGKGSKGSNGGNGVLFIYY